MYKRTPKPSGTSRKSSTMTVARERKTTPSVIPTSTVKKSPWPSLPDNDSSWEGNSAATSTSWAEDVEEAATKKVMDLWDAVEKTLYKEDNDTDEPLVQGSVLEECIQWRTQIPHLRVVGKAMSINIVDEDGEICSTVAQAENQADLTMEKEKPSFAKIKKELKNKILDHIVDYIISQLMKKESSQNTELGDELDNVLRITPAPTYSGRKSKKSNLSNSHSKCSANRMKSFELTELIDSRALIKYQMNNANNNTPVDDDDDDEDVILSQHGRNKPGTVFNRRVVVSPVPFAVTTRESFCTLKTTPIKYAGHLLELTTPKGFNRNMMSSASKINSAKRSTLSKIPQRHSAWQAPVTRSIYPKNVRLAPIDPTRLPSSKNRSLVPLSPVVIPQRSRKDLSPISRQLKVTSAENFTTENLEIKGKQITQSAKPSLIKNGWDNPRTRRRRKS